MFASKQFLQVCQISKESEGVRGKMSARNSAARGWGWPVTNASKWRHVFNLPYRRSNIVVCVLCPNLVHSYHSTYSTQYSTQLQMEFVLFLSLLRPGAIPPSVIPTPIPAHLFDSDSDSDSSTPFRFRFRLQSSWLRFRLRFRLQHYFYERFRFRFNSDSSTPYILIMTPELYKF